MDAERPYAVLVVDDNPATRYSTGRILRAASFEILEAATGQQAIEVAEGSPHGPDAIVLDVNLPDIDGFEVCRILRSKDKTTRTPIIHLSATFVETGHKVKGFEAGADGYLTHPVEPPVLVATVNAFLRARSAEDAMRRSEEKFRAIFSKAINGIALLSDDQTWLEVNPAMCRMLGRERDEIVGRSMTEFIPPGYAEEERKLSYELARRPEWSGSFPLVCPDGTHIELDWNVSFYSVPGIRLAVVSDVTERRTAEAERERLLVSERNARAESERANRVKDEFLATVSHELRSPLSAIIGWSHVLRSHENLNPVDLKTGILAIERNAKVQEKLIADLLDVSRITSGKLRLDLQPVDLVDIVRNSLDGFRESAARKRIAIEQRGEPGPCAVFGDAVRLQQVVGNLLSNAVKFSPEGGRVVVHVTKSGDAVEVAVTDEGRGIQAEFLPYIFDTFRQENATSTRAHEGLGLGLSIVKQLVEMHRGTVTVESPGVGRGATFRLRFPLVGDSASVGPGIGPVPDPESDRRALRGLRVLLVDDDPDARLVVRRLLLDFEVDIFEAKGAEDALGVLAGCRPQVVLSDISMPDTDGFAFLRRARAQGFSAEEMPFIALSALMHGDDRSQIGEGFQAYLSKPVQPNRLIQTLADVARSRRVAK